MTGWLAPVRAALDDAPSAVDLFVRDDDGGWREDRLLRLLDVLADLGLPVHFHILTSDRDDLSVMIHRKTRGPKIAQFLSIIRGVQDILLMLVYGGVFERHPRLRVVCA